MRRSTWLAGMGALLAIAAGQAAFADNSQQEKMTACNNQATAKGLSGEQRKSYMSTCLSKGGGQSTSTNSQQQKMKDCNTAASKKNLTGSDRESFMSKCLSKGGSTN